MSQGATEVGIPRQELGAAGTQMATETLIPCQMTGVMIHRILAEVSLPPAETTATLRTPDIQSAHNIISL